ncbi:MAG TPA: DUF6496 domain-containing protein [Acetobacteraceae bacterium]|nr:DUF6496 domain-containing protein [Acetobacteraceae bacterium]
MANRETPKQRATIRRVMHAFKHGVLGRGQGGRVRNPKQAIAIALAEAGASNRQSEATNRKRKERLSATRAALYAEAARRGIKGRSRMSKAELEKALR